MANSAAVDMNSWDHGTANNSSHSRSLPWICWLLTTCFTLFQFLLQLSSGVMLHEVMHSFTVTALGASIIGSAYYYIYVLLQTPAGMLMDHFKPRYLLTIGAFISALGCLLFGASTNFYLAILGRILTGGGCAFAFVGMLHVINEWFPPRNFSIMTGLGETVGMFGAAFGTVMLAKLLDVFHWRDCMFGAAIILVFIAIACWIFIRENEFNVARHKMRKERIPFATRFWLCLKNPLLWLNGLYSGLMFSVITVFISLWGIPFLMVKSHFSLTAASTACTAAYIGTAIGSPLYGYFHRLLGKHKLIFMISALCTASLSALVIYIPDLSFTMTFLLMFAIGITCSSYLLNFTLALDYGSHKATTTNLGFTNMLSMVTAPLLQPIVGLIMYLASTEKGSHLHAYNLHAYNLGLSVVPLALVFAAVIGIYLPEIKAKHPVSVPVQDPQIAHV